MRRVIALLICIVLVCASGLAFAEPWRCALCGALNHTEACWQCGKAQGGWACTNCGEICFRNFCTSCGSKKPESAPLDTNEADSDFRRIRAILPENYLYTHPCNGRALAGRIQSLEESSTGLAFTVGALGMACLPDFYEQKMTYVSDEYRELTIYGVSNLLEDNTMYAVTVETGNCFVTSLIIDSVELVIMVFYDPGPSTAMVAAVEKEDYNAWFGGRNRQGLLKNQHAFLSYSLADPVREMINRLAGD